jgi:hypothetical protein
MRSQSLSTWTFALAALVASAGSARAGDAIKLLVEPPTGVTTVEAGDAGVDVQISGQDAAGARVGVGAKTVEVSATNGDLVLVESPSKYHFTPPASIDASASVKLRAWLKQSPEVSGEANLTLVPHRPYDRLVVVAPATSVALGKSMTFEVRGVKTDGSTTAVANQTIKVTVDGGGAVAPASATTFTFTAPAATETKSIGATPHIHAYLDAYPKVVGDLSIVLAGQDGAAPPATPPAANPGTPPAPAAKADDVPGVVWPTGDVKLLVWRAKDDPKQDWNDAPKRKLPAAGKALIAPFAFQFLRIEILRDDVKKVEVEAWVDKKSSAVRTDDADRNGPLHLEKKSGRTDAVLMYEVPMDGKARVVDLLLTTADGKILTEEFVLQRGRDKDGDGEKDKKK